MTQSHAYLAAAVAAGVSLAIVVLMLRSARTRREGMDSIRLVANLLLLAIYWSIMAGVAALAVAGYVTKNYDYWLIGGSLFGVGMVMFNDITLSRRNPIAEWFSSTPLPDRISYLHRDTARLLDRHAARAAGKPEPEPEPDFYENPFGGIDVDYRFSRDTPDAEEIEKLKKEAGIDPADPNVKTSVKSFTFTIKLGKDRSRD